MTRMDTWITPEGSAKLACVGGTSFDLGTLHEEEAQAHVHTRTTGAHVKGGTAVLLPAPLVQAHVLVGALAVLPIARPISGCTDRSAERCSGRCTGRCTERYRT
eukprot:365441-Chlamydomonas_euryale.AAC.9